MLICRLSKLAVLAVLVSYSLEIAYAQGGVKCQISTQMKHRGGSMIDSSSKSIGIGQRAAFSLKDGAGGVQRIQVQPQHFGQGRVKATIDWQDARGASVVSTQMGLRNGENVALAAEGVGKHVLGAES